MFEINIDNHIKKIDFSSIIYYTESDNGKTTVWVKGKSIYNINVAYFSIEYDNLSKENLLKEAEDSMIGDFSDFNIYLEYIILYNEIKKILK